MVGILFIAVWPNRSFEQPLTDSVMMSSGAQQGCISGSERLQCTRTTKTPGAANASNKNAKHGRSPASTNSRKTTSSHNSEKTDAAEKSALLRRELSGARLGSSLSSSRLFLGAWFFFSGFRCWWNAPNHRDFPHHTHQGMHHEHGFIIPYTKNLPFWAKK